VLDRLDSSRNKDVKAAKPVHRDAGPEVEVELETGPYHVVLTKRFLKQPSTALRILKPSPQNLTSREAHERVQAILAETVDVALWKALRLAQGAALGPQANVQSATSLVDALDRATGRAADTGPAEWWRAPPCG